MPVIKQVALAVRSLRKNPGFAVTAIITLALGIGASTAIFSVVNAVLLRPLPYEAPERLAVVWAELRNRNVRNFPFAPADFKDFRDRGGETFSDIAAVQTGRITITDDASRPEMVRVAFVTSNLFSTLGLRSVVGRTFIDDDGAPQPPAPAQNAAQAQPQGAGAPQQLPQLPNIMVLSHEFWQRRYGGDTAIIGRTIPFGNNTAQVVGILQPGAELAMTPKAGIERYPDVWIAMRLNFEGASRIDHGLRVITRLRDGVTVQTAQAMIDRFGAGLREQFPIKNTAGLYFSVEPMHLDAVRAVRRPLILLLGAVGFVLLIACANVANLLLVRMSSRERELAVRAALGGSRSALVRQMLTESVVLSSVGAALGVLLAQAGIDLLAAIAPTNLPRLDGVRIDWIVLLFAVALSFASAALFGLIPALRASRPNVADVLRSGRASSQHGGTALRNAVVVAEVALSFVLLVGSGLMLRSFIAVARTDVGFDPNGVLTFQLQNPRLQGQGPAAAREFVAQLRARLLAIPGVTAVASANSLPLDGNDPNIRWVPEQLAGDEKAFRQAQFFGVHPSYFQAMRTQIVAGRAPTESDVPIPPVIPPETPPQQAQEIFQRWAANPRPILVDEMLAARAFPNGSAVGRRIMARTGGPVMTPFEIIGVVKHQRHTSIVGDEREMFFMLNFPANARWVVRSSGSGAGLQAQVRNAIAEIDPTIPISEVAMLSEFVDRGMAPTRFALVMLSIFAAIAGVLAAVGLYGVLASAVRQRTSEIGVRMAFGAPSRSIFALVIGQGLKLSAAGVVIGLIGALLMTGVLKTMLVDVSATDPLTFVVMSALFVAVAAFACWVPARRAMAVDPNVALREE